jgi:hypothetical protein
MPDAVVIRQFAMHGARAAIEGGLSHIEDQINSIEQGFASHGSGGPRPAMESVQALLAAQAADAIVGFLYRIHRQVRAPVQASQLVFDDNEAFNGYVDEANAVVRIFDLEYRPSEVLFSCDQQAYRDLLSGFEPEASHAGPEAV